MNARQRETIILTHRDRYKNPSCIVFCKPGDPGGHPYEDRLRRPVAEEFAAGRPITWLNDVEFEMDGDRYQVVADRVCMDVILRLRRRE